MTITINGNDYTSNVEAKSLRISQEITNEVDTCSFVIINPSVVPDVGDDLTIQDGATTLFAGVILRILNSVEKKQVYYTIECRDHTYSLDDKLVVETYENETVNDIIADINTQYLTGFTLSNVSCAEVIDFIRFDYESPSSCFQRLAEMTGYDWYVDYNQDIHFFQASGSPASFQLTDDSANIDNYEYSTLQKNDDISQLRNVIYVRGAEYPANTFTESIVADGEQLTIPTSYKYKNIAVTVDGTPQTVGVDFIDDPNSYDVLYNFQQKILRWRSDNKPALDDVVGISGNPYVPILAKVQDNASVLAYGEREYRVRDDTIKTKNGAKERAIAELLAYKNSLIEASFSTYKSGLNVGETITINSTSRGINDSFIIKRILIRAKSSSLLQYDVYLVSTKTYGFISLLKKLLSRRDVGEPTDEETTLQSIITITDSFSFSDAINSITTTSPPYTWVETNSMEWDDLGTDTYADLGTDTWAELTETFGMDNPIRWNKFTWVEG